jgi:hypothetical protein
MFSLFLVLIIISGLFAVTSLSVPLDSITLSHLHVHIMVLVCVSVYHLFVVSMPSDLHIE